jgi:hypothetical protein
MVKMRELTVMEQRQIAGGNNIALVIGFVYLFGALLSIWAAL